MILLWDIYEIRCDEETLHGIKLRGRIRKFSIENDVTCLAENASDAENIVRFALIEKTDPQLIVNFIKKLLPQVEVVESLKAVSNPVLSKLKVNDSKRYEIE